MIRKMNHNDIEFVAQLEKECFSRPWSKQSLKKEIDNPNSLFLVHEEKQKVIGYIGLYLIAEEADITNIAISESYRGKGYGRKLLTEAMNQVFSGDYHAVTLEVRKSNLAAIHLYQSMGFKVEGIRKNFYDFPTEDAYIMWKRK